MKLLNIILILSAILVSSILAYTPTIKPTVINGVTVYLLPEDGEPNEDGLIDQFWLLEQIKNGTVPKNLHLVDVRKPEKYKVSHIKGAINVPYDMKNEKLDTSKLPKDGLIVFYCNTGIKSSDAASSLDDDLAKRVLIFDITYKCDENNDNCKIIPNEAL